MLRRLTYWDNFLVYLLDHKVAIEAVVSCHLGLKETGSSYLAPLDGWIHESFNVCLLFTSKLGKNSEKIEL